MTNIVFIGASKFGLRALDRITTLPGCRVTGVVTAPQTFAISYNPKGVTNVLYADVAEYCRENNLPCEIMESGMKDEALFDKVKSWQPNLMVVVGWYHMVPKSWRDLAPCYGLHASLLPDYSGGAPLVWAIINGEKQAGISFFQFAGGVDNGPLVAQAATEITDDDTIATLYARIEELGLGLIETHLPRLADGTAPLHVQDETKRRIMPQRKPDDGLIDWHQPARRIYDFIRAQTKPYPGAFTLMDNNKITLWQARCNPQPAQGRAPGEIFASNGKFYAACAGDETIEILSIALNGADGAISDILPGKVAHAS